MDCWIVGGSTSALLVVYGVVHAIWGHGWRPWACEPTDVVVATPTYEQFINQKHHRGVLICPTDDEEQV